MTPETRNSLIARLQDPADEEAWQVFVEIYRPVILRLAQSKGIQAADAEDLAQKVLLSIANAIGRWEPDGPAKFRTWLRRITDNAIINALTRPKPDRGIGSSEIMELLHAQADRTSSTAQQLETEYQRETFQWAARNVSTEFSDESWQAFWLTAVEGKSADEVAKALGKNRGSIYTARSRVMKRLIEKVNEITEPEL